MQRPFRIDAPCRDGDCGGIQHALHHKHHERRRFIPKSIERRWLAGNASWFIIGHWLWLGVIIERSLYREIPCPHGIFMCERAIKAVKRYHVLDPWTFYRMPPAL